MTEPFYTPPRLRLVASYQTAAGGGPEQVEIELNDDSVPITSAFIGDLLARLLASGTTKEVTIAAPAWTGQPTPGGSFTFNTNPNPNGGNQ